MLDSLLLIALVGIAIIIFVANWKLFTKAGEKGWKALIPIYSTYVKIKITFNGSKNWLISGIILSFFSDLLGVSTTLVLLMFLIATVINLYVSYSFILRYNTSTGMALLSLFFPVIIMSIVAFSNKYQYDEYTEYVEE